MSASFFKQNVSVCLLCIFFVGITVNIFCNLPTKEYSQIYKNLNDTVKYVGMETCRKCHENIYKDFIQTGMGQSFDDANRKKSSAEFSASTCVRDTFKNFSYHPFWIRDSLLMTEFRLNNRDTAYKRTESIRYIIGSGQHTNSHLTENNGYICQAPMTFYTQSKTWDLPPGFEQGANSRFDRPIGLECMSCHNSYPDFVQGSENKYRSVPKGINCERCHGPGEIHVKEKMAGLIKDISKETDYSIVNPAKLQPDLQFDLCSRCHLQGNAVLNDGKSFTDFKPGMKLSDVMNVFMPRFQGKENEYIMASHVERLKLSRCFTETMKEAEKKKRSNSLYPYKDALTCVSCHNPHISVRKTSTEIFNQACQKCHGAKNTCTLSVAKREENNNNCVTCHMPKSGTSDIPHVITTDHYIRRKTEITEQKSSKTFLGLACINNPDADALTRAKAFLQYYEKFKKDPVYLDSASTLLLHSKKKTETIFAEHISLLYLKEDYQGIITLAEKSNTSSLLNTILVHPSWSNTDAWTLYRIGEAYLKTNDSKAASRFFRHAVKLAPYVPDFKNKLGASLMTSGARQEAQEIFEAIINENNRYAPAYCNLGYAFLMNEQNEQKAEAYYDKALSLNPDYEQAWMNKAGLYIFRKKYSIAKKILNDICKKNPGNLQAKQILISLSNQK